MANLEAVDAKMERAREQLRRLRGDAADFCRERSRLILSEQCGDRRLWVYQGGETALPVRWSIRAGEFAHNLRSALDQLVWQLAVTHAMWTGQWPRALLPASSAPPLQVCVEVPGAVERVGHELRYGQALLAVAGGRNWQQLDFPVDAYFDHLPRFGAGTGRSPPVAETLDACMDSVELVLGRLRKEL